MLDICIITKLSGCKFFNLIDSIFKYTDKETLKKCKFYICYTGNSTDEMNHIKESLGGLQNEIIMRQYHFAKNSNELADLGTGEYILFLNDDIEFESDTLTYCLNAIQNIPKVGTVGIKLLYPDNKIQHAGQVCFINPYNKRFLGVSHYMLKKPDEDLPNYISFGNTGAFLMLKRDLFYKAGMFDEEFQHCFEDVWLNVKCLMQGFNNVCLASQSAVHFESTTRKQNISKEDIYRINSCMQLASNFLLSLKDYKRTILRRKQ